MIDNIKDSYDLIKKADHRMREYIILESNIELKKIFQVRFPEIKPLTSIIPLEYVNTEQKFVASFTTPSENYTREFKAFLNHLDFLKKNSPVTGKYYYLMEFDIPNLLQLGHSYHQAVL